MKRGELKERQDRDRKEREWEQGKDAEKGEKRVRGSLSQRVKIIAGLV